jgi:hypothetical protein
VAVVKPVLASADSVAVIGENRKMLVFKLDELPGLGAGRACRLQRYRDGGLSDAIALRAGGGNQLAARRLRAGGSEARSTSLPGGRSRRFGTHRAERISEKQPVRAGADC